MASEFPTRGKSPYGPMVKEYIDTTAAEAAATSTAGSSTDAGVAYQVNNGAQTQLALDEGIADNINAPGSATATALNATIAGVAIPSTVVYAGGLPSTETIPLSTGGNLVKTYHWDSDANPVTCDWNYPAGTPDLIETFTYDGDGNATGSTFAEA